MIHTMFIVKRRLFCYRVMPFGLKNVGLTYQRLINKIFYKLIGKIVKAYIDDMVTKIRKALDYIRDSEEYFLIFWQYKMKLNPLKYVFECLQGKFWNIQ